MRQVVLYVSLISMVLLAGAVSTAQTSPIVKLSITLPDGHTQDVSTRESGVATVTAADGTEFGVRPTILDAKPWTHVLVTFFRMPTPNHGIEELGSVEVRTGGGVVQSKTNPAFKVTVKEVSESNLSTS